MPSDEQCTSSPEKEKPQANIMSNIELSEEEEEEKDSDQYEEDDDDIDDFRPETINIKNMEMSYTQDDDSEYKEEDKENKQDQSQKFDEIEVQDL